MRMHVESFTSLKKSDLKILVDFLNATKDQEKVMVYIEEDEHDCDDIVFSIVKD